MAIALIVVPAVTMAQKGCKSWWQWLLMLITLFLVAFLKVSAIWVLVSILVVSIAITMAAEGRKKK